MDPARTSTKVMLIIAVSATALVFSVTITTLNATTQNRATAQQENE
jgi:hypothetical protein